MTQVVDAKETKETHEMVVTLYHQYKADHIEIIRKASKIQRDLNRAEHEAGRIERHLARIEAFCTQHNISLEQQ